MPEYAYAVADVFTRTPLTGNPVAVFTNALGLTGERMQQIAQEMHLSETVFVLPAEKDGDVRIRIFTPVNELPFAGHPTLGTAIVLGETHPSDQLIMETMMGTVPFALERDASGHVEAARMSQPIPMSEPYELADELLKGLGLEGSLHGVEMYTNGPRHVFVGVGSVSELSALEPDQRVLARLPDMAANCFSGRGSAWRLRMFSPAYGVAEDAATGTAAGALAVHLRRHGLIEFNQWIEITQGVEIARPSVMHARVLGDAGEVTAVEVAGPAVIVAKGTLRI